MSEAPTPIRVGVAGFDYPDWRGRVYPKKRPKGFDAIRYLANYIDLIEINSSFYGPPSEETARKWIDRVADLPNMRYTARLWQRFTHERSTPWTRADADAVHAGFAPLMEAGRLDAVLIQLPWSCRNTERERECIGDIVAEFHDYPLVIEVRHATWNEPAFYQWLTEQGVGFVNIDQPLFARSIKPSMHATSSVGYVRVHGRNYDDWFRPDAGRDDRYNYLYDIDELAPWVDRTRTIADQPDTLGVAAVFNNHFMGQAFVNALQFKAMMIGKTVPAPQILIDLYPKELGRYAHAQDPAESGPPPEELTLF